MDYSIDEIIEQIKEKIKHYSCALITRNHLKSIVDYIEGMKAENGTLRKLVRELADDSSWWYRLEDEASPEDCDSHNELIGRAREALK